MARTGFPRWFSPAGVCNLTQQWAAAHVPLDMTNPSKPCIYGDRMYPEGGTICVNGRELRCVMGEWTETGHACTNPEGDDDAGRLPAGDDAPKGDRSA